MYVKFYCVECVALQHISDASASFLPHRAGRAGDARLVYFQMSTFIGGPYLWLAHS